MSVPVRPASGPVNGNALLAALSASAAYALWPAQWSYSLPSALAALGARRSALGAVAAVPAGLKAGRLMLKDYRLRRNLARAAEASTDHGTGREATWPEIVARGMDNPASGNFLGLHAGAQPVFAPSKTPFSLIEMPPGVGKTVTLVIGSILHQARLGKSLFIPDVKTELAPMLIAALKAMGVEVWCINPAKAHLALCGDTEINLYEAVIDAVHAPDAFRQDAVKLALDLAELHLPEQPGGADKNVYFRNGARRCIGIGILSQAMLDPARCTPSDAFALLNEPKAFRARLVKLRFEITRLFKDDPVAEFLKTEAANMLDRFEHNEENAASFLEGATQAVLAFNQGGRMAGCGRTATHTIATLRKRQIAVFVMSPLSHARDFAPVVSLLNHSLLEVCKRDPAGHPVHIVGEEALNYRFADIVSDMETMRGLKVSADFYVQSFSGLIKKYGRDAAASIDAYADVKVYSGLNSFERARHVSDMLAEATIRRQDYSFKAEAGEINVSSREQGRRVMTPDEILAMPRGEAWVFVRGLRPLRLTMVDYGRIAPWRDEVAANPLEGARLRGAPLFGIRYPARAAGAASARHVLEGVHAPAKARPARRRRRVWPVRLRHLLWLPQVLALWSIGPLDVALPHLRTAYSYTGPESLPFYRACDYVGPHPRTLRPANGRCPLVAFFGAN